MLVFVEGGKLEDPVKNPQNKDANQQKSQPTYDAGSGNRTWATLVGGERSPHCATLLPVVLFLHTHSWELNGPQAVLNDHHIYSPKRLRGRPRVSWQRTVVEQMKAACFNWKTLSGLAQNRVRWPMLREELMGLS